MNNMMNTLSYTIIELERTGRKKMKCRKPIIYGGVSVVGAGLAVLFLIEDRWMRSPRYYIDEIQDYGYKFNIGFHWTTLLGMLGIILFLTGICFLMDLKKYVIEMAASSVFLINLLAWDFFISTSDTYYRLVMGYETNIVIWSNILKYISAVFMVGLVIAVIQSKMDGCESVSCRVLSALVLVSATASLMIKTVCNQWFFFQTLLAFMVVILIHVGRKQHETMLIRKRRAGWKVL